MSQSKTKGLPIFIFLFICSLGLNGFLVYKYTQHTQETKQLHMEMTLAYETMHIQKDSLFANLEKTHATLQSKIEKDLAQPYLLQDIKNRLTQIKLNLIAKEDELKSKMTSHTDVKSGLLHLIEAKKSLILLEQNYNDTLQRLRKEQQVYFNTLDIVADSTVTDQF